MYGLLRTSDSLSPIAAPAVAASLTAFIIVYFFVFGAGTYYLLRMMNKPVKEVADNAMHKEGPIRTAGVTQVAQYHARKKED